MKFIGRDALFFQPIVIVFIEGEESDLLTIGKLLSAVDVGLVHMFAEARLLHDFSLSESSTVVEVLESFIIDQDIGVEIVLVRGSRERYWAEVGDERFLEMEFRLELILLEAGIVKILLAMTDEHMEGAAECGDGEILGTQEVWLSALKLHLELGFQYLRC